MLVSIKTFGKNGVLLTPDDRIIRYMAKYARTLKCDPINGSFVGLLSDYTKVVASDNLSSITDTLNSTGECKINNPWTDVVITKLGDISMMVTVKIFYDNELVPLHVMPEIGESLRAGLPEATYNDGTIIVDLDQYLEFSKFDDKADIKSHMVEYGVFSEMSDCDVKLLIEKVES